MQGIAAASSSSPAPYGAWAYLVVFALMALSFVSALLAGLAIAAACIVLAIRYYRRRKARRLLGDVASPGTSPSSG